MIDLLLSITYGEFMSGVAFVEVAVLGLRNDSRESCPHPAQPIQARLPGL
jgi:hypothetical protein